MTYFLFYVVLVANNHNFLFVQWISYKLMAHTNLVYYYCYYLLNIKKELLDNIKCIVLIDSVTFVNKN